MHRALRCSCRITPKAYSVSEGPICYAPTSALPLTLTETLSSHSLLFWPHPLPAAPHTSLKNAAHPQRSSPRCQLGLLAHFVQISAQRSPDQIVFQTSLAKPALHSLSQSLFSLSSDIKLYICLFAHYTHTHKNVSSFEQGLRWVISLSPAPGTVPAVQKLLHQHLLNELMSGPCISGNAVR